MIGAGRRQAEERCGRVSGDPASGRHPSCHRGGVTEPTELGSRQVLLRTTTSAGRSALVDIRSTPEVRRRWRGVDLEAEFDEDLDDDEVHRLTIQDGSGRMIGRATDAIRTLVASLFERVAVIVRRSPRRSATMRRSWCEKASG